MRTHTTPCPTLIAAGFAGLVAKGVVRSQSLAQALAHPLYSRLIHLHAVLLGRQIEVYPDLHTHQRPTVQAPQAPYPISPLRMRGYDHKRAAAGDRDD